MYYRPWTKQAIESARLRAMRNGCNYIGWDDRTKSWKIARHPSEAERVHVGENTIWYHIDHYTGEQLSACLEDRYESIRPR